MRFAILLAMLVTCVSANADEWKAPANPDPQAILQEARSDARARRYETALAKHLWFHENALAIDPDLYGVRLSFALADWLKLANKVTRFVQRAEEQKRW